MRVQDCIVSVRRRSIGGNIDLSFAFMRQFWWPILGLTALFAVPSTIFVWYYSHWSREPLIPSLFMFGVASALLSGALIAGIGPQVFGVPLDVASGLSGLRSRLTGYSFWMAMVRMLQAFCSFCFAWPILLITPYIGHVAEIIFLERAPMRQVSRRLNHIAGNGGYFRNLLSTLVLMVLWLLMSLGLFVTADTLSNSLFNQPIFLKRLDMSPDLFEAIVQLLTRDPLVITTAQVAIWLPFPLIRLAWFFCYLDQRIRNECWDIELQFRIEAERLEELQ